MFELKQSVSETESNQHFRKNVKNMSTKQESLSGATFKAWPFSSIFNFVCRDGQVTKNSRAPFKMWQSFWIHHAWKLVQFCDGYKAVTRKKMFIDKWIPKIPKVQNIYLQIVHIIMKAANGGSLTEKKTM